MLEPTHVADATSQVHADDPDGVELCVNLAKRRHDGTDWRTVDEAELLDAARR